jgi:excisionase family DNA binding protein
VGLSNKSRPTRQDKATYVPGNVPAAPGVAGTGSALTVKEAAARLGISPSLVYTLCARAKIRHERHGLGRGVIRIPPEALDEYRRGATVAGTVSAPTPPAARVKLSHIKL